MATTKDFLISIGVDKASVDAFISEIQSVKDKAASDPIEVTVDVDATAAAEAAAALKEEMDAAASVTTEAMGRADAAVDTLKQSLVAVGVAAAGLTAILSRASSEASGDEQSYAALAISFGSIANKAAAASEEINKTTGRATGYIQTLLAETNLAVSAFGFAGEEALDVSRKMVQAAIDMSAITGEDAATILDQFRTGLQLSGRALLRYGINLDDARVKAEALKKGLDPKALTQYQESQIKLNLIMQDTSRFTGAASGANQTFTERLKDLSDAVAEAFGELGVGVNEALKPFLEGIVDVVGGLKLWFKENPKLTRAIAQFGIVLTGVLGTMVVLAGTIAGLTFAYRQYTAIQTLITGAQTAYALAVTTSTAAVVTNSAATVANTATKEANIAAVQAQALGASFVGKAMQTLNAILSTSNAQILLNTQAWLSQLRVRAADWIYSAWQAMAAFTASLYANAGALLTGQVGLRTFINTLGGQLVPALAQSVGSLSALGVAAAAAATAFLGFKLGGYIEEWLGLADAQERVQNGTASLGDAIKSKLVDGLLLAIPGIGWAALAWKKYYEYQSEALRGANAEEIKKQVDTLNPEQLARYNQALKEGAVDWVALKIAIGGTAGEVTKFQFLLGLKNNATPEQLAELEGLFIKLSDTVPGFAARYGAAMGQVVASTASVKLSLESAKNILKTTQEAFDEAKKKLEATNLRLNLGEDAAKAYESLDELGKVMTNFRTRADAHVQTIQRLNEAGYTGTAAAGARKQVTDQEAALKDIQRLAEIAAREQSRIVEESFKKQETAYKGAFDAEVKAAQERKDKLVAIEQAKFDEIKALIDKEVEIRKSANERALAFEKSLDDAALRRHDQTQADIKDLNERAAVALKDASSEEDRARILAKVAEETKRLATIDDEAKRIAKDIADIRKQDTKDTQALADARAALTKATVDATGAGTEDERAAAADQIKQAAEREADAKERVATTQEKLAELVKAQATEEGLRAERATKATQETAALAATSEAQAKAAADRDKEILSLQQAKLLAAKNINDAEREFQAEVVKSKTEYEKKLEVLDRMFKRMTEIVALQKQLTVQTATPGTEAAAKANVTRGELSAAQTTLKTISQEQTGLATEPATLDSQIKTSVDALKQEVFDAGQKVEASGAAVTSISADVEVARTTAEASSLALRDTASQVDISIQGLGAAVALMIPASDALLQKTAAVETAIQPVPEAMNKALEAQTGLAGSVERLGNTTLEFAAGMKAKWNETTGRLEAIEARISRLGEGGAGAAQGYGG